MVCFPQGRHLPISFLAFLGTYHPTSYSLSCNLSLCLHMLGYDVHRVPERFSLQDNLSNQALKKSTKSKQICGMCLHVWGCHSIVDILCTRSSVTGTDCPFGLWLLSYLSSPASCVPWRSLCLVQTCPSWSPCWNSPCSLIEGRKRRLISLKRSQRVFNRARSQLSPQAFCCLLTEYSQQSLWN